MKKILLTTLLLAVAVFVFAPSAQALLASDNGSNYGGGWSSGDNFGTGFLAWSISSDPGTAGFAGNFIGDPAGSGITGMSATSFGLFANPSGSGAFVNADREFASAMSVGDTFSFQWGMNWDSGATGNKGFNIYTGSPGTGEIVNVNNGGSETITFNGVDTGFAFGTEAMTWSFTLNDATTVAVSATGRDGVGAFSTNVTVASAPLSFRFYASDMQNGGEAQPYFNNLEVVPEPSTYALLTLGALALGGYAARRRARK
jgi:hypothetical protein